MEGKWASIQDNNLYILSEQLKLLEVQLADTFKGSSPSLAQIMT